ncbi:MAG: glycosyltransferase family 4 protein [Candidatus Saccharimonadales bacterium]
MKIGLVCPYNFLRGGGVQECVIALQNELKLRGHSVYIITPTPRDSENSFQKDVIFLGSGADVKSVFHTTGQISVSVNTDILDEVLARHKFDIIHFHEPWVPILSRQILTRSKSINIATFHAKLPETVMSRTIEKVITPYTRSILKYFDAFTAVSLPASEYVKSLTKHDIQIIPNGIDLSKYASSHESTHGSYILYIGRLEKRKGVKFLLKAWSLLAENHPKMHLIIAGEGADKQKLENFTITSKIPRVKFVGYVNENKKQELLNNALMFCSPARYGESFGIVLLEALAKGLPIVAGDNPGYASVLQGRGKMGLVDTRLTTEFARKIDSFLIDKDLRTLWKEWALEYVKQYEYRQVVDQYEKMYKQLLT